MVKPRLKRPVVDYLKSTHGLSERRACGLIQLERASYRYQILPDRDDVLRNRLKALATQYPVYGYLMLHALLKQEGLVINKKRTYRLYTEEQLQVRTKRRKKLYRPRQVLDVPSRTNQRWSMIIVENALVKWSIHHSQDNALHGF